MSIFRFSYQVAVLHQKQQTYIYVFNSHEAEFPKNGLMRGFIVIMMNLELSIQMGGGNIDGTKQS